MVVSAINKQTDQTGDQAAVTAEKVCFWVKWVGISVTVDTGGHHEGKAKAQPTDEDPDGWFSHPAAFCVVR